MKMLKGKRGSFQVVDIAVGAIMVVVLIVAVAYPIMTDVVNTANTSGRSTDALILKYLPTMLLIVALVAIAAFLYFRGK